MQPTKPNIANSTGAANPIRGQIVRTADDQIEAPKFIISTVQAARSIYYTFRAEHLKRIQLYAAIEGLIAGNPPYDPQELIKNGLAHISNFNNLDARSLYERGALAYWNLLNAAKYIAKIELIYPQANQEGQGSKILEWNDILSRHWNDVIRSWPDFYTEFSTLSGQLLKFGVSPVLWPDERDFRWRTVELQRFFVQDQAQSAISQLTTACLETIVNVQYLMEVYEKFKDAPEESTPWNVKEIARLLIMRANSFAKPGLEIFDMMDLQRRLQNGDFNYADLFTDGVRLVSLLYQEYDGKITHMMFDKYFDGGDFLYFADRQYSRMEEATVIFTYSPGEFTIHSNRGLGHKIFSGSQATMQLDCSAVDAGRWAASIFLRSGATGSKDPEPIRFTQGAPINIGTAEFAETNIGENLNQIVQLSQFITSKMNYNIANSGDDPSIPDKSVGSLSDSQARHQSFKEFGVLKNNIAHFYSKMDIVFDNMLQKMWAGKKGYPGYEYMAEWKDRCVAEGVPEQIFENKTKNNFGKLKTIRISATRVAGDGSQLARIIGLESLAPIAQGFGPKQAREYQRELISAAYGPEYVSAFITSENDADAQSGGATVAGLENGMMRSTGESPIFSMDNDHYAHAATHLALGSDTLQKLQQGQYNPVEADKIFEVLIPHLGQHIQALEKSFFAKQFLEGGVLQSYKQLEREAIFNKKNAGAMVEAELKKRQIAAQADSQVQSDAARKDFVAKADVKRSDYKVQQQVERAKEANQTRAEVQKTKVEGDVEAKKLKVQLEAEAKKPLADVPTPALEAELSQITGQTISPYDFETPKAPPGE